MSYSGPVFRYESPQAGRSRQFHEFGCELIGADGLLADVETVLLALSCIQDAHVDHPVLVLGHIGVVLGYLHQLDLDHRVQDWLLWNMEQIRRGHADAREIPNHLVADAHSADPVDLSALDRTAVVELLRQSGVEFEAGSRSAEEIVDGLFDKGQRGANREAIENAIEFVTTLVSSAGDPITAFPKLKELVDANGLSREPIDELEEIVRIVVGTGFDMNAIHIDLGLGRGLRYYTGILFEIYAGEADGLQIAGGGRYDDLARQLGARRMVPSAGFSIGLERLDAASKGSRRGRLATERARPSRRQSIEAIGLAESLRAAGWIAILDIRQRSENAARRWAARNGFQAVAVVSPDGGLVSIAGPANRSTLICHHLPRMPLHHDRQPDAPDRARQQGNLSGRDQSISLQRRTRRLAPEPTSIHREDSDDSRG